ncbi:MAG: hypothetical protein ACREEP_18865 [Dongiaceae bacterium]
MAMPPNLAVVPKGGELAVVPISAPRLPQSEAAGTAAPAAKPHALPKLAESEVPPFPLAPHPFQPEWAATPFRSAPVEGASTLVALKPNLAACMKPATAPESAVGAPQKTPAQPTARKSHPQSLDEMLDALIDSIAAGQPAGPLPKASHPSIRR